MIDEVQQWNKEDQARADQAGRWLSRGPPNGLDEWCQAVSGYLPEEDNAGNPVHLARDWVTKNCDLGYQPCGQRAVWLLRVAAATYLPFGIHGQAAWRASSS